MAYSIDDKNLQRLFAEMDPKRRAQALKGGFRKEAQRVRKTAINNLRSGLQSNKDLEKGIRAIVFKRAAGFRVTVGTKRANRHGKGEAGFHTNRYGKRKPVLIWAEEGTKQRKTAKGKARGRMRRYGFMAKTLQDVKNNVTNNVHELVTENVIRVANKYGCR